MLFKTVFTLTIAISVASCGRLQNIGPRSSDTPDKNLYEATATVLEDRKHGPMLCLGAILDSLPPQCGDVPLIHWDWDEVEGEKHRAGTTWGSFHVIGTFDGSSLTVSEVGAPAQDGELDGDPIDTPCPAPEGGWHAVRSDASDNNQYGAQKIAQSQPDFAGLWIDYIDERAAEEGAYANPDTDPEAIESGLGPENIILNVAFTGDLERHEAEIREVWGGALCVVEHERTEKELSHIQRDLDDAAEDLGLQILFTSGDVVDNLVELEVVILTEEAKEALDARYGEGAVRATGALQPVQS